MQSRRKIFRGLVFWAVLLATTPAWGQRLRFSQNQGAATYPAPSAITPIQPGAAPAQVAPMAPPVYGQNFDPYSSPGGASPGLLGAPTGVPSILPGGGGITADPFSGPSYGPACPPLAPPTLFPGAACAPTVTAPPLKFLQNIRLEGTYIYDDLEENPQGLEIIEWEAATTIAYPNFAYSGQPLLVSPGFAMNHLSGPQTDPANMFFADLPSAVYGAWVDLGWFPNSHFAPNMVSYELTGRLGIFSDFDTFNENSFRPQGTALIKLRITPTLTAKAGVEYINRVDIDLLPAGGFLWTPTAHTRWDIYFPRPKLATYFTTLGNTEIWGYLGGEYGGDSWTIERTNVGGLHPGVATPTFEDRFDYNDYRVVAGLEWWSQYGAKGFIEAGYVFNREVVYEMFPADNFEPDDTFMVRAGAAY